ncbi:hypothetical protein SORBI_3006G038050 [Sorghum bicolor]|uniref:Uncharacterized protein n=1 Tax=Sorghum bicolor TaxID=4558 RepID=A0A1Z5RCI6_SORBI|nr:hypothetical protein SORBI_3006G038050 [Sorghum bicolor]
MIQIFFKYNVKGHYSRRHHSVGAEIYNAHTSPSAICLPRTKDSDVFIWSFNNPELLSRDAPSFLTCSEKEPHGLNIIHRSHLRKWT